jgi:hypothetical protein
LHHTLCCTFRHIIISWFLFRTEDDRYSRPFHAAVDAEAVTVAELAVEADPEAIAEMVDIVK